MTLVLSQEELVELTDYRRPADQRRWLSERGIPYDVGASGRPKVLRSVLEKAACQEQPVYDCGRFSQEGLDLQPWKGTGETPEEWLERNAESLFKSRTNLLSEAQIYIDRNSSNGRGIGVSDAGIYFIIFEGQIIYVGRAKNIGHRLWSHFMKSRFPVEYVSTLHPIPPDLLDEVEGFYIEYLEPPCNIAQPGVPHELQGLLERARKGEIWPEDQA